MASGQGKKLFGTDGIRGRAYEYPLDLDTVARIGWALGDNLARDLGRAPRLVIGRDTRESGAAIQAALTRGAQAAGAEIASAGVTTTPGVAFITRTTPFDAGVVISASHNPYFDNGIKVFSPTGRKLADDMERRIEEDLDSQKIEDAAREMPLPAGESEAYTGERAATQTATQSAARTIAQTVEDGYAASYLDYLVKQVAGDLRLDGVRLAIDCANGAASDFAPRLFRRLGADIEVIACAPDGRNINENCGALHIEALQSLVAGGGFDMGVAFDGDADRALFVDGAGRLVDGDATLLLLAESLQMAGKLHDNLVVATVMSNLGLELALRERGIELLRAQVGDRYVLEEMLSRHASLGGEQSGHIIIKDVSLAGDGLITAIELLRAIRQAGKPLAQMAAAMKSYPQVLVNVRVRRKPPLEELPEVGAAMAELENELQGRGRLLVRYSGTENLLRVMIEGEEQARIEEQAHRLAAILKRAID